MNIPAPDSQRVMRAAERIDPNTATVASLRRLPGIGPVRARAIVDYRADKKAPFVTLEDLHHVRGIGPGTTQRIADEMALPGRP